MFGSSSSCTARTRISIGFLAVAIALTAGAPAAFAFGDALPCSSGASSAVFARWLDPAQYVAASNGGFEQGSRDWQLSDGATTAAGNEPYAVGGSDDSQSLVLGPGATAESRTACIMMNQPTVRLFVNTPRVLGAVLLIDATVRNPATGLSVDVQYRVIGGLTPAGWAPTLPIVIGNVGAGVLAEDLTVRFEVQGVPATWAVDDVYVDPFKSF